jgi:hypothetical protein
MSIVEETGAYAAGRFAGKLAGKVETQNELNPKIWDLEHKLIAVVNNLNYERGRANDNFALILKSIKAHEKLYCLQQGYFELLDKIEVETAAIAAHVVEHGSISGADLARVAPFTLERRLPLEQRVNGSKLVREAALRTLEGERQAFLREHMAEHVDEIISWARQEILEW